jgi:TolA-binding protein
MKRLCILLLFVLPLGISAQTAKKAFKKLEKNEFSVAKVLFDKMISEKEDIAVAEFGLAKIYSNPDYMSTDLFRAWKYIYAAESHLGDMDQERLAKLDDYLTKADFQSEKKRIDDALLAEVKQKDDLNISKRFVKECKASPHHQTVKLLMHSQAYKKAVEYDNVLAFKEFMLTYPDAKQVDQAQEHIYSLEWSKTMRTNTVKGYNDFIKRYPEAPQKQVAEDKIREIEYAKVMLVGTSDAYEDFLKTYPNTKQAEKVLAQWEQQLYFQSKSMNLLSLQNKFLARFPNSKYAAEIKELRDENAYQDAKKVNTPEAYATFIKNYPDAKQVPEVMSLQAEFSFSALELRQMKERQVIKSQGLISYEVMLVMENDTMKTRQYEKKVYDQHGNVFDLNSYPSANEHFLLAYRYSEDGQQLLAVETKKGQAISHTIKRTFNEDGLCVEEEHECFKASCASTEIKQKHTLEYDAKRNLIKRTIYHSDSLLYSVDYIYDSKGQLLLEVYSGTYAPEIIKISRQYDFYGNLLQVSKMAANDKIREVKSYTYDKQGNMLSESGYDAVGKIKKEYFYNSQNQIEKVRVSFPNKPESTYFLYYTYITM